MSDTAIAIEHPAKWSAPVLGVIADVVAAEADRAGVPVRVVDPFAGVGLDRLRAALGGSAVTVDGLELEPEWAAQSTGCTVGDAFAPPWPDDSFDVLATSPVYPNRVTDHHDARDDSRRITYRHKLRRMPSDGSTAVLGWGRAYRERHQEAWRIWRRLVVPGGLAVLNVANHVTDKGTVEHLVVEWHLNDWLKAGCKLVEARRVATRKMKLGVNRDYRADGEMVLVLRTPNPRSLL